MKRDMDYVRELLIKIYDANKPLEFEDCFLMDKTEEEVSYHLWLLEQTNLIDSVSFYADNKRYKFTIKGLTWDGQDFVDAMRDIRVWSKTKDTIKKAVGTTTISVIKATCVAVSQQLINAQLGILQH